MTFLEAAIEILRHERDPLHFAEITKRAVERKLLSHVGRDPETAMQTCLNSAVRSNTYEGLLVRDKPGHFQLRSGVTLPDLPLPPGARAAALGLGAEKANGSVASRRDSSNPRELSGGPGRASGRSSGGGGGGEPAGSGGDDSGGRGRKKPSRSKKKAAFADKPVEVVEKVVGRSKKAGRRAAPVRTPVEEPEELEIDELETDEADEAEADEPEADEAESGESETPEPEMDDSDEADEADDADADEADEPSPSRSLAAVSGQLPGGAPPLPALDPSKIRFRGPQGSGLEGETDITLVMANAVSRLVEERPELRSELEAMQRPAPASQHAMGSSNPVEVIEVRKRSVERRDDRKEALDEDRGGRRRRRRRRRSRRLEWSEGGGLRTAAAGSDELLDKVAGVLADVGGRSLHIRQIAENLAAQNVLGGEISEIERAVTAALLLDVHRRGDASRFAVRGDARYQLRGGRVPEKAAAAEHAARRALLALEQESERQLLQWLQALGARSLESVVRIWLDREEHAVLATLAPGRGLGKLIVEDPEGDDDEGRLLVVILPRKTPIDPKLWEGEAERSGCSGTLLFAMGEPGELAPEVRVIGAADLARWMIRQRIGVRVARFEVPVLDADLIESIAGLDT